MSIPNEWTDLTPSELQTQKNSIYRRSKLSAVKMIVFFSTVADQATFDCLSDTVFFDQSATVENEKKLWVSQRVK